MIGRTLRLFTASIALGGCTAAVRGPPEPVVSPTGVVYEFGTRPRNTRYSQTAALYLSQGRTEEAAAIYTALLSEAELEASELFNLGIALFRSSDFEAAGEAFERLTRLQPMSRD